MRVRIASLQYFIRPVRTFDEFADQVSSLVNTAKDYKVNLVVFPEYFSAQLLTLGAIHAPMPEQVRRLANQSERIIELFVGLAKKSGLHIVGGTVPIIISGSTVEDAVIENRSYLFLPNGQYYWQGKLHMTRFEKEEWMVSPAKELHVFETNIGNLAINICYDVEFPEMARAAAQKGAQILVVPSCTDDRQGYYRVRYCAQARAIENQFFVVQSSTVGSLPMVPAVSLNYGQSAILTPSDFAFARDGILAEGIPNQETMVIGDVNLSVLDEARNSGTVLPFNDHTSKKGATLEAIVQNLRT